MAKDPLHNSLRPVITRARAVHFVVFLAKAAIGCKKTPHGPSQSACHSLARVMQRVLKLTRESLSQFLPDVELATRHNDAWSE